jgi:glycosyltransferase involved in cell wall biosynthesis
MIVRDEEQNLKECLEPVAELFDEIIIVDTGSHDGTKRIALEFTPHIFDFSWCDDFSAARNESLSHATGDWIFWLDADDRLRPPHVAGLEALFDQLGDRPRVYLMDTAILSTGDMEETCFVTHQRLFRRHPDLHWHGRVHEQLKPDFPALGYECVFSDVEIYHLGYRERTLAERKARRKLRLLRMDYAVDPDNTSTLLHLGMALKNTNRREARSHLLRLVRGDRGSAGWARWAYDGLANIALVEGEPEEAIRFAQLGLRQFADDEDLLFAEAAAYYAQEDYDAATRVLNQILRSSPSRHMKFGSLSNIKNKLAPRMLGAVQRMQQAFDEAEATLLALLRDFPTDVTAWYNLGLVYVDQGRGQQVAEVGQRLLNVAGGVGDAGLLAVLWHLRQGDPALAGPLLDRVIADAPHSPRPRMLRAEWLSRMQAPIEAQIQALRDILRVQPGNVEARQWIDKAHRFKAAQAAPVSSPWFTSVAMAGAAAG